MEKKRYVGFEIHALDRMIGRKAAAVTEEKCDGSLSLIGSWVIGYLHHHQDQDIYQKDIEREFHMPPSTVTKLLKHMEKSGYIRRSAVQQDARLKKLEITPEGEKAHVRIIDTIHQEVDSRLLEGITDQEAKLLFDLIDRMKNNLE